MGNQIKNTTPILKIKAYPIPVKIWTSEANPPLIGEIQRVTTVGFQVVIQNTMLQIGEQYKIEFTLPFYNKIITEKIKIIKTMDRYKDSKATIKEYLVEMHFVSLSKNYQSAISTFEAAIKQKV